MNDVPQSKDGEKVKEDHLEELGFKASSEFCRLAIHIHSIYFCSEEIQNNFIKEVYAALQDACEGPPAAFILFQDKYNIRMKLLWLMRSVFSIWRKKYGDA